MEIKIEEDETVDSDNRGLRNWDCLAVESTKVERWWFAFFQIISKGIDFFFFFDCWSAEDSNIVPSGLCILCSSLLLMYSITLPLMINYTQHEASILLIFNSGHTSAERSLKLQCLRPHLYRAWFYFTYFYYLFIHLFSTVWLLLRGTPAVWITVYY